MRLTRSALIALLGDLPTPCHHTEVHRALSTQGICITPHALRQRLYGLEADGVLKRTRRAMFALISSEAVRSVYAQDLQARFRAEAEALLTEYETAHGDLIELITAHSVALAKQALAKQTLDQAEAEVNTSGWAVNRQREKMAHLRQALNDVACAVNNGGRND